MNIKLGDMVVTKALAKKPTKGLIYFLHGPCDSGPGLQSWVNKTINGNFAFKHFPVLYPSSPTKEYSLHEGKKEAIWFDQLAITPNVPEDWGTINIVGRELSRLINDGENENGVTPENVIVGGFSMGGAMALHLGYKFCTNIAGVFALSSFLPPDSRLYESMEMKISMSSVIKYKNNEPTEDPTTNVKFPKLFMSHGKQDPIVSLRWGKATFNELRKRGVKGHFFTIDNTQHSVSKQQLGLLHDWISDTLSIKKEDAGATK